MTFGDTIELERLTGEMAAIQRLLITGKARQPSRLLAQYRTDRRELKTLERRYDGKHCVWSDE